MKSAKQTVLAAIYAAGTAAVAALALLTVIGGGRILFPDAMLPMELRELASAWLAIGSLLMLPVSAQFYKVVRRRAVFVPAAVCLLAMLLWVGTWTLGMVRNPAMASGGDIVLPPAEKIEAARFTGNGLDLTFGGKAFVTQLLHRMSQAENTGRTSVQDVPDQGAEVVRIDLYFKRTIGKGPGGVSTVFLYRKDDALLLEQPYQGIYRIGNDLGDWLQEQIEKGLEQGRKE